MASVIDTLYPNAVFHTVALSGTDLETVSILDSSRRAVIQACYDDGRLYRLLIPEVARPHWDYFLDLIDRYRESGSPSFRASMPILF